MNYIVLDLEWNQYQSRQPCPKNKKGIYLRNEIIQIGAVKLDEAFRPADEFKTSIKLPRGKKISAHVAKIVQVSQEEIEQGIGFQNAAKRFKEWCGTPCAFITWGFDDIRVLSQNLEYYYLDASWTENWYNLQLILGAQHEIPHRQIALYKAAEMLGIQLELPLHDALNDAIYAAYICSALDMETGVENYKNMAAYVPKADESLLCDHRHFRCSNYNTALEDEAVNNILCPRCNEPLVDKTEWITISPDKYAMMGSCRKHGKYVVRLLLTKNKDGSLHASRMTYTAGGKMEQDFLTRVKRRAVLTSTGGKRAGQARAKSQKARKNPCDPQRFRIKNFSGLVRGRVYFWLCQNI